MRRREFIAMLGTGAAAWPLAARAQQSAKLHRIGYLHGGTEAANRGFVDEFRAGMHDLGHIEGHDFCSMRGLRRDILNVSHRSPRNWLR